MRRRFTGLCMAVALVLTAPPALAGWEEPAPGPLRFAPDRVAEAPDLAVVDGVMHAAWSESDGDNRHIRVARLVEGTWRQVGIPRTCAVTFLTCSPLNRDDDRNALRPAIADVGGRPWVAWMEDDGTNFELRVARLTEAGAWQRVADGPSPLNLDPAMDASSPRIAAAGGVPYVSWLEDNAGNSNDVHVARLTPGGAWQRVGAEAPGRVDGVSVAHGPDLAVIDGVPHVSWLSPLTGQGTQLTVARLNPAGTGWDRSVPLVGTRFATTDHDLGGAGGAPLLAYVDGGDGTPRLRVARLAAGGAGWGTAGDGQPLNAPGSGLGEPDLELVGGVPHLAWSEAATGSSSRIRVARLGPSGVWEPVADTPGAIGTGVGPILEPALAAAGPVPFVVYRENLPAPATSTEIRVERLQPDVLSTTAVPSTTSASLFATVQTWGLPLDASFEYGPGAPTAVTPATGVAAGSGVVGVSQPVTGLAPGTAHVFRPVLRSGDAVVRGPDATFSTLPLPGPGAAPGAAPSPPAGPARGTPRATAALPRLVCRVTPRGRRCTVTVPTRLRPGTRVRVRLLLGRRVLATAGPLRIGRGGRLVVTVSPRARLRPVRHVLVLTRTAGRRTVATRVAVRAG